MTERLKMMDEGYGSFPVDDTNLNTSSGDLGKRNADLVPEITPRLSVMSSKLLLQKTLEKYDTDLVPDETPTATVLKKWKTEPELKTTKNDLCVKSNSAIDIGMEKDSDKAMKMNPLRKWRENHLATSTDVSIQEEDEEELSSHISGVSTPQPDTDLESETDTDKDMGQEQSIQLGSSSMQVAPKKGFLRFLKSLSPESKIPKVGIKKPAGEINLASRIPKPIVKVTKPESPGASKKLPLLSKLYNLSKREPILPKIDFANLTLFDNPEPDEFVEDLEAQREIQRFMKKYTVIKQIGTGGHSTVRLAQNNSDSTKVVAKFIHSSNVWQWHSTGPDRLPLEIVMMQTFAQLKVASVIKYIEHFRMGQRFIIIMEYLGENWVDLYDYIELYGPVKEHTSRKIFKKVVKVISDMHVLGYSHNDVKDENVMINKQTLEIKLIDFGSTFPLSSKPATIFYGTQKFSAPEALHGNPYMLEEQEVWALGTLLYVLLFKMDPFSDDEEIMELNISKRIRRLLNKKNEEGEPKYEISERAVDALCMMLSKDPAGRPKVSELLKLDFFIGL